MPLTSRPDSVSRKALAAGFGWKNVTCVHRRLAPYRSQKSGAVQVRKGCKQGYNPLSYRNWQGGLALMNCILKKGSATVNRYVLIVSIAFAAIMASFADAQANRPSPAKDSSAAVRAAGDKSAPRPNILYFYVDDMGWGAIGPNGQAARKARNLPYVLTPSLDRLAAEGVNFTRSYGATVCSPARSSQQSGFHQGHTFADRNDPNNAKKAMRADDVLMGDVLSKAGYVTGYWGKWGYGGSKAKTDPVIENVQTLPTSHGYRHVVAELHHVRAHTFFQPTLWTAPAASEAVGGLELTPNSMAKYAGDPAYPTAPALQNHPGYPATAYCDDVYAFAALDFVRAQAKNYRTTGQPFFGLLAVQIPHAPFGEVAKLPEWDNAYRNHPHFASLSDQSKQWAAMVTRIDAHFGNILAALEDPNGDGDRSDSVADNTLVIFQSDNGGPRHSANEEFDANGGLRGSKGRIHEGGIRIPTIMRWPARITADSALKVGTSSNRVMDVSDLLPTFCELAGAPTPVGIDGVSLAPTLLGTGHQRTREFLIHEAGNGQSIIRGSHKLIRSKNTIELYDLDADPSEANDIASDNPALVEYHRNLLLGERVAEPKGFANTYHRWTGKDGAETSNPDHWSDYVYANAGITYMTDKGAPRVSWIAIMENTGTADAQAKADADLEFLGLEIRGHAASSATQTLILDAGVNLTGRNEVRISSHGSLALDGGAVSSLRWVEVKPGGTLQGSGNVNATLYNQGSVSVQADSGDAALKVRSNYVELGNSTLNLSLSGKGSTKLLVQGHAHLAGALTVSVSPGYTATQGKPFTILTAGKIDGSFANARNQVVANNGARFEIGYTATTVTLTAMGERNGASASRTDK
jgi:arylsulfatase A-like enzyme